MNQGAKGPFGCDVDAKWRNTIDMGSEDRSDDPRLKDSLGLHQLNPGFQKTRTHRKRLYVTIHVQIDIRKVKRVVLFSAGNSPGAPLPSHLGGAEADTAWQVREHPPLECQKARVANVMPPIGEAINNLR
jgi:hypothetical protein